MNGPAFLRRGRYSNTEPARAAQMSTLAQVTVHLILYIHTDIIVLPYVSLDKQPEWNQDVSWGLTVCCFQINGKVLKAAWQKR